MNAIQAITTCPNCQETYEADYYDKLVASSVDDHGNELAVIDFSQLRPWHHLPVSCTVCSHSMCYACLVNTHMHQLRHDETAAAASSERQVENNNQVITCSVVCSACKQAGFTVTEPMIHEGYCAALAQLLLVDASLLTSGQKKTTTTTTSATAKALAKLDAGQSKQRVRASSTPASSPPANKTAPVASPTSKSSSAPSSFTKSSSTPCLHATRAPATTTTTTATATTTTSTAAATTAATATATATTITFPRMKKHEGRLSSIKAFQHFQDKKSANAKTCLPERKHPSPRSVISAPLTMSTIPKIVRTTSEDSSNTKYYSIGCGSRSTCSSRSEEEEDEEQEEPFDELDDVDLSDKIRAEHSLGVEGLGTARYLARLPLGAILNQPHSVRRKWLQQVKAARRRNEHDKKQASPPIEEPNEDDVVTSSRVQSLALEPASFNFITDISAYSAETRSSMTKEAGVEVLSNFLSPIGRITSLLST